MGEIGAATVAHHPNFDLVLEVKEAREEESGFRFRSVASTGNTDRDGESIDPRGWVFPKAAVPLFFGHAGYREARNWIGFVERASVEGDSLLLDNFIPKARHNEVGEKMTDFLKLGISVPGSVGFDPRAWTNRDGSKGQRGYGEPFPGPAVGRRYTGQELLEFSLVPVPSNTDSRVLALSKALLELEQDGTGRGIRSLIYSLVGNGGQPEPRTGLEKVWAQLNRSSGGGPPDTSRLVVLRALLAETESAIRAEDN